MKKRKDSNLKIPKYPLVAELKDIKECLGLLGKNPIKLIVEKPHKEFNESEWKKQKWSFKKRKEKVLEREILPNQNDLFQLSVANQNSKQDFHTHKCVFDIFVSNSKMEATYIIDKKKKSISVSKGVLIIPPNVSHKVKLSGLAFIFQGVIQKSRIHGDKKIIKV